MKTHVSLARASRSRVTRPLPGRTFGMTAGRRRRRGRILERGRPEQHGSIADMDATLSVLDIIDLLRIDVHRTAHFIYSDIDEP
ncbi:MAG TPA: hypothetical protein VF510_05745 [Ktedonobacterales bacterium]